MIEPSTTNSTGVTRTWSDQQQAGRERSPSAVTNPTAPLSDLAERAASLRFVDASRAPAPHRRIFEPLA